MKCTECKKSFEYFSGEEAAYSKFEVPMPENCPECRQRRRLVFRNERNLYYNKSCMSGKSVIALYHERSPFKVIDQDEWWSDKFDATEYGRDFDFNRPFFEQFRELQKEVPRWPRIFINCENSDFTNNCANVKNSYLLFASHNSNDCYYGVKVYNSNNCVDCVNLDGCDYCSQLVNAQRCNNVHYSQSVENCHDGYFLFDCASCSDCILSAGLRNKKYIIMNQQYTKEEYEKYKKDFLLKLWTNKKDLEKLFEEIKLATPHQAVVLNNCENCTGDLLTNCKDIENGFYVYDSEDCINIYKSIKMKSCNDVFSLDESELCIECDTSYELYNCKFCTYVGSSNDMQYCDQCFSDENCFGCVGLKKSKFMILNKQYSEEDYNEMIEKIGEHMKKTGEYGKPFPSNLSAFAYNESAAQDEYPLKKDRAKEIGYRWYEEFAEAEHFGQKTELPSSPEKLEESICDQILVCRTSGKNYKVIPQEFRFYKQQKLPIPDISPDQRYKTLNILQNPQRLRPGNCASCQKEIQSTYPENTSYKTYCEDCYLKTVY